MGEADNEGKLSLSIFLSKKNLAALVLTLLLALKESLLQPWSCSIISSFHFQRVKSHQKPP